MPTLRQKVEQFCVVAGTTNASSMRIAKLEEALKKAKETHKHQLHLAKAAAKTKKVKATPKAPKAPAAPKPPKVKQEVAMQPLPAAMPQTATVATAGRRTRRRRY